MKRKEDFKSVYTYIENIGGLNWVPKSETEVIDNVENEVRMVDKKRKTSVWDDTYRRALWRSPSRCLFNPSQPLGGGLSHLEYCS